MSCEGEKRMEMRWLTSFDRLVSETEHLVLNYLIYCELVKRFVNRSDTMKFWNSSDSSGIKTENILKTVDLSSWKLSRKVLRKSTSE